MTDKKTNPLKNSNDMNQDGTLNSFGNDTVFEGIGGLEVESPIQSVHKEKTEETKRHYSMLGKLGEGAMGEIVMARDQDLQRKVAYKKILPSMAKNNKVLQGFLTEAQITAQLEHPNIVPIYGLEVNQHGNIAYSMKMIKGHTLGDLIEEANNQYKKDNKVEEEYSLNALLEHFLKLCDAIHYAHMKGIIHRDLKPANMMIGPYNEVYVMDWGIARIIAGANEKINSNEDLIELDITEKETALTEKGRVIGTPRYMSPQQAAGKNETLDGRSDQFSLGLILFELVTLKKAFKAKKAMELLKKVLKAKIEPIEHAYSKVKIPKELKAIITKSTSRKPSDRYESVEDFSDDIRRFLRGEAVLAQPDTFVQKTLRWMLHHRELTALIVMGVFLVSAASSAYNIYRHEQGLIAAQIHEHRLNKFLHSVVEQSQLINNHFLHMEVLLEGLGTTINQLLNQSYIPRGDVFTVEGKHPANMPHSEFYKSKLSTTNWIAKVAYGMKIEQVEIPLKKINPLNQLFPSLFIKSAHLNPHDEWTTDSIWKLIAEKGTPLTWAYVGLESGSFSIYPGTLQYPPKYDHRKRPWYKEAKKVGVKSWTTPFVGGSGMGLLLSCEMPLYDLKNQFRGVAGMDMTFNYVKKHLLMLKNPAVKASYLVNQKGEIVISSIQKQDFHVTNKERKVIPFPNEKVLKSILEEKSGYILENDYLTAFYKIDALGWYYVIEGVESNILKDIVGDH